jgi:glycosyltransferase involved in cell wall biosynthesis
MKSICLVVQSIYDSDPRVRRKAEALVAAGYAVDVLALRAPNGEARYVLNGVTVYTVSLGKKRGSLARYLFEYAAFFLWTFVRVPMLMRRRHYVAVDVNTLPDFLIFAPIVARWMGAALVLDMHEITPEFYMSKYGIARDSMLIRLITWLERVSFDFADRVLTINQPILELLVRRGLSPAKATVIMNAADEAAFAQAARRPAETDPAQRDRFVMMYHGTLTRTYGLDLAVEAFAIAHKDMPGAEIWILGSGPESDALAEQARRCGLGSAVRLVGQVPANEIPAWLAQCDLGLLPFRVDVFLDFAFPNKLPEFIIAGKPVAIPRMTSIRHYFSEDALAYFEANDAADLARQMVRVYRDRPLGRRLSARAIEEYAPIRWDVMKRRYLDVVHAIAGDVREAVAPAGAPLADKAAGR